MLSRGSVGIRVFLVAVLSIFLLPVSSAALVEIYVNDENMLVNELEGNYVVQGGKDLELVIRLDGDYRMFDSNNENLSVQKMSVNVEFLSDEDSRGTTSGIPQPEPESNDASITYEEFSSTFRASDPIFKDYNGDIRFSILLKNDTGVIVKDEQFVITLQSASSGGSDSGGFSLPSIPSEIAGVSIIFILGGIVGLIILSVGVYTFVLAPEDTTADLYRPKESIDPLSKSLTGVGYDSELPGESKLKRLENGDEDSDEEEDDEDDENYVDIDDEDEDKDFDESALLASLTGESNLKSADEEEEPEPKKKTVKKKVAKKTVAKKKVVRKAAPPKDKPKAAEPAVNMGEGITRVTCPSCEKVHNVDENVGKFICTCGRRIRV
jgi:hypothetical protein